MRTLLTLAFCFATTAFAEPVSLFDGKSLDGWDSDPAIWRVEEGMITGGSTTEKIKENHFICTKKSYQNFELKLKIKCSGDPKTGMINSGIQVRSVRVPGGAHMSGYQVDCGDGWFGKIYDEFRRNKVIAEPVDAAALTKAVDIFGWNEYRIRAEGPRIQAWINGVLAIDYTEQDKNIALDGQIGPQVHAGGICLVQFKDVTIEELPPTPNAPTWESLGGVEKARQLVAPPRPQPKAKADTTAKGKRDISYNAVTTPALPPDQARAAFKVPDGFTVELVASERDGIGKFISLAWDHAGRLWTQTAFDYPVDANENKAFAEALYAKGGRDKILVFDHPETTGPHKPRVFAEGLAIPLGILPWKDGCYAQYGHDIRLYRDTDGDGKADKHEAILTGFGIDDSHLFPHQFTPAPGGWIYLAQGAFNHGDVHRPDGKPLATGSLFSVTPKDATHFSFCKLARMRPDGSDFQLLSSGPNNIWGLVLDRTGEVFAQEANDTGYPIIPFRNGTHVPGIGQDKLKPYAPIQPPSLTPPQMGGTGLSGLALKEEPGWPVEFTGTKDARIFYVANPITNRVQRVKATVSGSGYVFEKLDDFMTTTDPWFRPIAIQFGPDGCLYVVDWCNKIISHNEVPRAHPDRDKTRGRIWRVRNKDQPMPEIPDLTKMSNENIVLYLESPNQWAQRTAAWELGDRKAKELLPTLKTLVNDENKSSDTRISALWAWENIGGADTKPLLQMLKDPDRDIRREAARALTNFARELGAQQIADLLKPLATDADDQVRTAAVQTLSTIAQPNEAVLDLLVRFVNPPQGTSDYERDFQRYLVRAALELHPVELAGYMKSKAAQKLPAENRVAVGLILPRDQALLHAIERLDRAPNDEEVVAMLTPDRLPGLPASQAQDPVLQFSSPWSQAVTDIFNKPANRVPSLEAALRQKVRINHAYASVLLAMQIDEVGSAAEKDPKLLPLYMKLAAEFPNPNHAYSITEIALNPNADPEMRVLAIETLPTLSAKETVKLVPLATETALPPAIRLAAIGAIAASKPDVAAAQLATLWPKLNALERSKLTGKLVSTKGSAKVLLDAIAAGSVKDSQLDASLLERLHALFPNDPEMQKLWGRVAKNFVRVLRLHGSRDGYVDSNLTLAGPFTVESWVRLQGIIDNGDGIIANGKGFGPNFFAKKFRVFVGGDLHDIVVATKEMVPGAWTHVAFTRDDKGIFRIYLNGELDATSTKATTETFAECDIGRSPVANKGTMGEFTEFRVWNVCRSAEEIRADLDRTFAGEPLPEHLVTYHSPLSDWKGRTEATKLLSVLPGPHLLSAAEAKAQAEKLAKYKLIAQRPGDAKAGQLTFTTLCLSCHTVAGMGGNLAPALDGSSNRDIDGLLRALLTPNAAVEGGYRTFRVETKDGKLVEGFLATRDEKGITLRMMGGIEQRINMVDVAKADFTERSLMIEGLLEPMPEEQVANLLAFIRTLK